MPRSLARRLCAWAVATGTIATSVLPAPGGAAVPGPRPRAIVASPQAALSAYREAVATLPMPSNLTFEYLVTRSGPTRIITEEHRVYRDGAGRERNETIAVNGTKVVPTIAQVFRHAEWPYGAEKFIVSAAAYDVTFTGQGVVRGRRVYGFSAKRFRKSDFEVNGLYLDASRFLPVRETFTVLGKGCEGTGSVDFVPVREFWLIVSISASCVSSLRGSTSQDAPPPFRERIRFSKYAFPKTLPPQVFGPSVAQTPAGGSTAR